MGLFYDIGKFLELSYIIKNAPRGSHCGGLEYEEVMLTDNTTVGIARTDEVTECAAVEKDDDEEKVQHRSLRSALFYQTPCKYGKLVL